MLKMTKNGLSYNVVGKSEEYAKMHPDRWFNEEELFVAIEKYQNKKDGIFLDVGSWYGNILLYSTFFFNKVIGIEGDPICFGELKKNCEANNFNNIVLLQKCLGDRNEKMKFGTEKGLGVSESTILFRNENYVNTRKNSLINNYPQYSAESIDNHIKKNTIMVDSITIESLVDELKIDPSKISLIKFDIEGGELIVIPAMKDFLKKYRIPLFITLHNYSYLNLEQSNIILDILFDIYENNCYEVHRDMLETKKTRESNFSYKNRDIVLIFK